jgi:hypothetical protein
MKAVITKSQFDRIRNFINETKEISKEDVLSDKQKATFNMDGDDKPFEPEDLAILRTKKRGIEEKKYSDKESSFIGKEISHLMRDKGYPHKRAVAAAINQIDEDDDCGCGDSGEDTRYMFFSNLEQMMRQARMLLQMDEDMLEDLLNNGHDWAADHIAEAKNNMDQVFDFIMGEMHGEGEDDSWHNEKEMVYEAMSLKKKVKTSKELKHHLDKNIPLSESIFRSGSEKHINLLKEVKELYNKGLINLNESDEFIVNEFDPNPVKIKGIGEVYLGLIQEEYESDEQFLSEAVYQGRKVQLGKAFLTPDGPKKRSVYVRNDKGNVVKVNFGDPNMKIKKNIPARRKSFRARHNCANPGPRWKARYWSCKAW